MSLEQPVSEWVVTYRMQPRYGAQPCNEERLIDSTCEFFRGPRSECVRIAKAFGGGENDTVRSHPWQVIIGPAADWDEFLEDE